MPTGSIDLNPDRGPARRNAVAAIIAAKDAAGTIARAVLSALAQRAVAEVIVVDDGSSDDTAARARACDDGTGRLRISVLPRNVGPSAARNHAIDLSTASILAVLDADDYFAPDRIETLMDAAGEDWDLAADGVTMLREDGDARSVQRLDFRTMVGRDLLRAEDFICGNIVRPGAVRMELGFMKPLLRREFLQRRGMRFDESLRLGEDYALYAEALIRGARFRLVASCGYVSVWRAGSLSSSHVGADLAALAEADSRLLRIEPMSASVKIALHQHRASTLRRADYRILLELKQKRRFRRFATFSLTRPLVVAHALREKMRGILAGAA